MDHFEYLTILTSVVIGLGVTHLLQGLLQIFERKRPAIIYSTILLMAAVLALEYINVWWWLWHSQNAPWTAVLLTLVIIGPVCLYIASYLLFPKRAEEIFQSSEYVNALRGASIFLVLAETWQKLLGPLLGIYRWEDYYTDGLKWDWILMSLSVYGGCALLLLTRSKGFHILAVCILLTGSLFAVYTYR